MKDLCWCCALCCCYVDHLAACSLRRYGSSFLAQVPLCTFPCTPFSAHLSLHTCHLLVSYCGDLLTSTTTCKPFQSLTLLRCFLAHLSLHTFPPTPFLAQLSLHNFPLRISLHTFPCTPFLSQFPCTPFLAHRLPAGVTLWSPPHLPHHW